MSGSDLRLLPYMKMLDLREWPCKSHTKSTGKLLAKAFTSRFAWKIVGWMVLCGFRHLLFRSTPSTPHLWFPFTTPSGFSIGTTLNTNWFLSCSATGLALVKKSSTPFIT